MGAYWACAHEFFLSDGHMKPDPKYYGRSWGRKWLRGLSFWPVSLCPYHPCMVYFLTVILKINQNQPNVGKYTIHGLFGLGQFLFLVILLDGLGEVWIVFFDRNFRDGKRNTEV